MLNRILIHSAPRQTAVITAFALLLVTAALLLFLQSPAEAQDNSKTPSNLAVSSPNPGELVITWGAPSDVPDDYRLTWKKSNGKWPSYKNENTVDGGNAFPTATSHTVSDLEAGTEYSVRVRARYHDSNGNVEQSGPWSDPPVELTIAALPAKPTGLSTSPSHDSVLLSWTDPSDNGITGYQILRGPDRDNLAVLTADTGTSYTDNTVTAETTYVYAIRARNAHGLSPQSDGVSAVTPAAPEPPAKPTGLSTSPSHDSVVLAWTDPNDNSITGYQVLRGPDAANLTVLNNDTSSGTASYTDNTVDAETTYAYAIRAKNTQGLGPQSDAVPEVTTAAPVPPAKPTGLLTGSSHNTVLLFWTDPGDDSITGYQVLRGDDADSLTVLTGDTGTTSASYTDDTVEAETTYAYAIQARNAEGLGPQSDTVSVTTQAAPEELLTELAVAGVDFIIAGQMMNTTGTCSQTDISQIVDDCTHDITNPMPQFGVVGTLDTDDRVSVKVGRDFAGLTDVAGQSDLQGANERILLDLQPGRQLLRIWGDENTEPGGAEQHFFRVNVVPYWELDGERLSKDSACRSATTRTAAEITDSKCILTNFKPGFFSFHNVISDHFNAYVDVNTVKIVNEPGNTALAEPFTLDLQDGENVVRVRLAAKGSQPLAETYDSDSFYYKVTAKDVLVSNLGQIIDDTDVLGIDQGGAIGIRAANATQFTTGTNAAGYEITAVRLDIGIIGDAVPMVSIYSDSANSPHSSIKVLTNPSNLPSVTRTEYDNGNSNIGQANFGASNLKLEPNKKYWLVIERASGDDGIIYGYMNTTATDPGGAPGWTINGGKFLSDGETWTETSFTLFPAHFAVKGALSTVSDDATLSGLLLDSTLAPTSISLTPAFDSEVTEYTATFANQYSDATFQVTTNDDNATVEFLDENDATIPTTGTTLPNIHYLESDLAEGANVFKVKVTAEDTTTTKTYEVTVTRVDFLVSNLAKETDDYFAINVTQGFATSFTTGSYDDGYRVSTVQLEIAVVTGTAPRVSIYSDSSGRPGSSLKDLTNPPSVPSVSQTQYNDGEVDPEERGFDAGNFNLAANTKYWVVIERASGSGSMVVNFADADGEDIGSAPDWSIGDDSFHRKSGQIWSNADLSEYSVQLAVKGALGASSDATLSGLVLTDPSNNVVALNPMFASGVDSYTATVANAVDRIKVEPTRNDDNASIQYLDGDDMALIDADASTPDVFDVDLAEGETVVKVQ